MLICEAGGAPPAGPGNATSVLVAISFQLVTSFACAIAGAAHFPLAPSPTSGRPVSSVPRRVPGLHSSFVVSFDGPWPRLPPETRRHCSASWLSPKKWEATSRLRHKSSRSSESSWSPTRSRIASRTASGSGSGSASVARAMTGWGIRPCPTGTSQTSTRLQQLGRSHVYAVWFRPFGVGRELNVASPSPPWHTKTFLFDRRPGRDFTERDRLVLDLLQPHFGHLWRAAQTRRRLRAALAALEWQGEHQARGVIVLAPGGGIELISAAARRLVHEYFGASRQAGLPAALADWLEVGSGTMRRQRGDRRLTIDRSGDALLLEETREELGLTARERQILAWVVRGKTNPEIAELLWIAPTTVRKHLEHVYAKLGVRTRTAAVARFLGVLDDQAGRDVVATLTTRARSRRHGRGE